MRPPFDIEFALKAVVGTASPILGVVTSFQEQIEWHLRIASLLIGLAVGVMSLIGLWRKLKRGRRRNRFSFNAPPRAGRPG